MNRLGYLLIAILFAVLSLSFSVIDNNSNTKTITDFSLKNVDNKKVSLSSYKNAKGFMVIFTCNKCPMAKFYSNRLNTLNKYYKTKGVYLLAIDAMDTLAYKEESFTLMQKKAKADKLNFPYLQDKSQVVAKQFKATHTPQAFIIWKNKSGKYDIKYEGAIDDNAGDAANAKPFFGRSS
ncbi:redoxin domain-containing protein [Flavobacterium paronense]|uniref:redoxin domain-containing protein n=1 Tax=Flavobacterium paronense TaxID=1392775 RepID=UPI0025B5F269|nr:redoxin domain-containing protein [Flavobacterium paronense]MDN3675876.1 redoxin domain-containing protein [Flavobacterium paronense]